MTEYCYFIGSICPHEVSIENQCFIIMSYKRSKKLESAFYEIIRKKYKLKPIIARKVKIKGSSLVICEKVCRELKRSLICFADVSRDNTNVGFEIGIAWRYNKPTILTMNKRMRKDPPSDLAGLHRIQYNSYKELKTKLVTEVDIDQISKIREEKVEDRRYELLLHMLKKYPFEKKLSQRF